MFRITRGHQVQHIHFPLSVVRDLDALENGETGEDASPSEAAAPLPATEAAAQADGAGDAAQ